MIYIGLTKQSVADRWQNGEGYKKQPVYKFIKEFGWDNIEHIILAQNITREEAQTLEQQLIEQYAEICYNESSGGGCGSSSWCEFEYNGETYTSEELAAFGADGVTGHTLTTRINSRGWDIDRALNQPVVHRGGIMVEYDNKLYTIDELYELRKNKKITKQQIRNRILHHNWDVERALTQSPNKKLQPHGIKERTYEYNGVLYNTWELCQLSPLENLLPVDITTRVNKHGWSVERAITQPKRKR